MSLYRLYRPKTFPDVVGQDHIVSTLEQAVKQGKLSHAYLFAGPRGTGKTSIARILAKAMLTQGIEEDKLKEQIIKAVEDGSLIDLTEIDAASNRGIDDIRSLLEKIQFSPVVGKAKVYIIDEVHMLTREAFNALLKTLEEPPAYAFFILATTELHKVLPTIQSRCQRFLFRQVREEEIVRRLQFIADQERIMVDRAALRAIAHSAQGSLRDALSLLDQLRSLPAVTLEDVKQRVGETGHEFVEAILIAIEQRKGDELLALVAKMEEQAVPLENVVRLLLGQVRESLHASVEQGKPAGPLLDILDALLETIRDMRIAPVPGLVLESALLGLCAPAGERAAAAAPAFVKPIPAESPSTAQPKQTAAVKPETPVPATVEAPEVTMGNLEAAWSDVLKGTTPPAVRMSLKNAALRGLDGMTVNLTFSSAFHRDKVSAIEAARTIEEVLAKIFKKPLKLKCALEDERKAQMTGDMVNLADAAAEIF